MIFSPQEKLALKKGYQVIAGIDEAGRGPLAGPVAAAAVAISTGLLRRPDVTSGLLAMTKGKDSKQFSAKQREEIFEMIKNEPAIEWRTSFVWPKVIDRINIWQATLVAWQRCLKKLNLYPPKFSEGKFRRAQPAFLFLDGKIGIPNLKIEQEPVIKGDQKIFLLSLASIIAKVTRDRLMERLSQRYPEYEFAQHKGYGTKLHLERLKKFGPCQIHRKSFRPVFKNLSFGEKVYYLVSQIPRGQVMTYQEVAQKIGHPRAFRAVGNVLNKNPNPYPGPFSKEKVAGRVPCHRVIRSDGQLGGYGRGSQIKRVLLKKEGFI